MKGQLVETRKVSFIEQREMCHVEKGLADEYSSVDIKNGIVGIVNWGFRWSNCPFFVGGVYTRLPISVTHPFTNRSRKSRPLMHPGTLLSLVCRKPKHLQMRQQISGRVCADTSATAECLVNTLNTKGDTSVGFYTLMWEKWFAIQISHRFQSCIDIERVNSCTIYECQCHRKKYLAHHLLLRSPLRRCKAGRQTYCGSDVC